MGNEIEKTKNTLDTISEKLKGYLDVRDNILDSEYVQVLGDVSKVVGLLRNASSLIAQKRFEAFLKGFKPDGIPTEEQLARLRDYINNEEKAQFISDTLSKILLSKSTKSCTILGIIMYEVIENKQNISHDYLVCIDALMNLFDKDIENIKFIYEFLDTTEFGRFYSLGRQFRNAYKSVNIDKSSMELTLEKAVNYQLLKRTYEIEVDLDIDDDSPSSSSGRAENEELYHKSNPGKLLFDFIKVVS
ncbi:hypothetical protein [Priestia flexa]|uniref:hypothetical protein n=1 Tax=Priestia flexa TaxID=86664 RepID=UPI001CD31144|nr:hypothetical protein [Priestia flexa]MCA1200853.1 hypothetical protein [Priestia flexa]